MEIKVVLAIIFAIFANVNAEDCDQINGDRDIKFPENDGDYGNNEFQCWEMTPDNGEFVQIVITDFELEWSPDCQNDFVHFQKINTKTEEVGGEEVEVEEIKDFEDRPLLCGSLGQKIDDRPRQLILQGPTRVESEVETEKVDGKVRISFRSDGNGIVGRGIKFKIKEVEQNERVDTDGDCGGVIIVDESGTGQDGIRDLRGYGNSRRCKWSFVDKNGVDINVKVDFDSAFDVQGTDSVKCFDFLTITVNDVAQPPTCDLPSQSFEGNVVIEFSSDQAVSKDGFLFTYSKST